VQIKKFNHNSLFGEIINNLNQTNAA